MPFEIGRPFSGWAAKVDSGVWLNLNSDSQRLKADLFGSACGMPEGMP